MQRVFGLAADRPLPRFRRDTFERWHAARGPRRATRGRRLVYYFGCFANYNDPEVGQAAVEILEALGHEVVLPRWRCCGIPLYAKGEIAAARRMAETNVAALAAHVDAGDEIVTSCPSCHLALARDYPRLFPSPAADRVAAHTQFLSRLLLADEELPRRLGAASGRAAYHLPCHLRAVGMERDSVELLGAVPGLSVTSLERGCCGLSGTFGLERARYAQSMEIGGGVFTAVKEGDFDQVLTDCGACKMQLEHGTGRSVTHPLEVLRRALVAGDAMPAAARALGAAR
jgi:glycerol-3-phosphate dehydrogenase subunit C